MGGARLVASLALGAALCLGSAGCVGGSASPTPLLACEAAVTEGTLVLHPGEGTGLASLGEVTPIVWPLDYKIQSGGGRTDVRNERGNTVASVGDQLRLRGGLDDEGRWWVCGEPLDRR